LTYLTFKLTQEKMAIVGSTNIKEGVEVRSRVERKREKERIRTYSTSDHSEIISFRVPCSMLRNKRRKWNLRERERGNV
jgi:hypothetical protein